MIQIRGMRTWGLALAAMFLFSAAAAADASAAEWRLNGSPITSAVEFKGSGTLELTDESGGVFGEQITIRCSLATTGTVGPGPADTTEGVTFSSCSTVSGTCGLPSAKPAHVPWKTELKETGGSVRDSITSDGAGSPGFVIECFFFGFGESDTCTSQRGQPQVARSISPVPIIFDAGSGTFDCTRGGAGKGHVRGTVSVSSPKGTLTVG